MPRPRPSGESDATPAPRDDGEEPSPWERRVRAVAGVVAPTTVLTALMVYFGYVYEWAYYDYFGVDLASLQLSNQDLLLTSIAALYVPIGALFALGIAATWAHNAVLAATRVSDRARRVRATSIVTVCVGLLVFLRGVYGIVVPDVARSEPIAVSPACLGGGAVLVAYGRYLYRMVTPLADPSPGSVARVTRNWAETAGTFMVAGILVLSLFWAANSAASAFGRGDAATTVEHIMERPGIILDTTEQLNIDVPGLSEYSLPGPTFRYRYRGLRLLTQTDDKLFVLTDQWDRSTSPTLVIPNKDNIRLAFLPGR